MTGEMKCERERASHPHYAVWRALPYQKIMWGSHQVVQHAASGVVPTVPYNTSCRANHSTRCWDQVVHMDAQHAWSASEWPWTLEGPHDMLRVPTGGTP